MRNVVYLVLFDGFADWEPALATCEIREHGGYDLVTVGFDDSTVTSMGGMQIIPQIRLDQIAVERTVMLVIPGGSRWEDTPDLDEDEKLIRLVQLLRGQHVPLAAICSGTLLLGRAGVLKGVRHTSNSLDYLLENLTDYSEDAYYVDAPAVRHKHVITASGSGYVEFTREILGLLRIYDESALEVWYDLFKKGVVAGLR
ncbi:MAG: DJ-1/PfpI family protein [Candidatus Eremiobacterota bacterium]